MKLTRAIANSVADALKRAGVEAGQILIVGVSGGADSMALLYALQATGRDFHVVHVEHGLRGEDSIEDARFVERICNQLGCPYHLVAVDATAEAAQRGKGVQEAARHLRYAAFAEFAARHGAAVLTAHHGDDQLETRILHLMRGGSLSGLGGMALRSDERSFPLVRPLLETPRVELIAALQESGHSWREDDSNTDPHYLRSRIRHELLPLLRDLQPGFEGPLGRLGERAGEAAKAIEVQFAPLLQHIKATGTIPVEAFKASPAPRLLADAIAREFQIGAQHVEALLSLTSDSNSAPNTTGRAFETACYRISRTGGHITIHAQPARAKDNRDNRSKPGNNDIATQAATIELKGTHPLLTWTDVKHDPGRAINPDIRTAQLDSDTLKWPMTLRPWKAGDRLQPIGMVGSQKVSDLLNQRKRSPSQRSKTLVLESNGQIAWVLGERIAAPFALSPNTLRITTFTMLGDENDTADRTRDVSFERI
jgi:tRNA(Ile)-lysidine synthase